MRRKLKQSESANLATHLDALGQVLLVGVDGALGEA